MSIEEVGFIVSYHIQHTAYSIVATRELAKIKHNTEPMA
jgi:hypothetical protein